MLSLYNDQHLVWVVTKSIKSIRFSILTVKIVKKHSYHTPVSVTYYYTILLHTDITIDSLSLCV